MKHGAAVARAARNNVLQGAAVSYGMADSYDVEYYDGTDAPPAIPDTAGACRLAHKARLINRWWELSVMELFTQPAAIEERARLLNEYKQLELEDQVGESGMTSAELGTMSAEHGNTSAERGTPAVKAEECKAEDYISLKCEDDET